MQLTNALGKFSIHLFVSLTSAWNPAPYPYKGLQWQPGSGQLWPPHTYITKGIKCINLRKNAVREVSVAGNCNNVHTPGIINTMNIFTIGQGSSFLPLHLWLNNCLQLRFPLLCVHRPCSQPSSHDLIFPVCRTSPYSYPSHHPETTHAHTIHLLFTICPEAAVNLFLQSHVQISAGSARAQTTYLDRPIPFAVTKQKVSRLSFICLDRVMLFLSGPIFGSRIQNATWQPLETVLAMVANIMQSTRNIDCIII